MDKLVIVIASGVMSGMVYAMLALAFVLLKRASGVINVALGELVTIGALVTYSLRADHGFPLVLAGLVAIVVGMAVAGVIDLTLLRPAHGRLELSLMLTFGAALVIQAVARLIWGASQYTSLPYDGVPRRVGLGLGDATVNGQVIYVALGLLVVYSGITWLVAKTGFGLRLRATAADREVATAYGVRTNRVVLGTSILAGGIAALSGFLLLPVIAFTYHGGALLAVKGIVAWILGGYHRIDGALVGGLVLGVSEALVGGYLVSGWQDSIVFAGLIALLVFRPGGLLGGAHPEGVR